jgi:eukaryotic-like serine/threonine-protein kinase
MTEQLVEFLRKKDFLLKEELGRGACGRTVLLYDSVIDEYFVCKKYSPVNAELKELLYSNFVREIKLLHLLNHLNVVRVFNYYLYPHVFAGFILMEYVRGTDVEKYLTNAPEDVSEIFAQVIDGFVHLERNSILHRDIRPGNILVTDLGVVKIIDFGFGKQTSGQDDFGKSITLNWWCDPPMEFGEGKYDYTTEVYFVGKLFAKVIDEHNLTQFKHMGLLRRMCANSPSQRVISFAEIRKELLADKFLDIDFEAWEIGVYREFSGALVESISKVEKSAKYNDDVTDVQAKLETCYKRVMLEEYVPDASQLLRCFMTGEYYYRSGMRIAVQPLKEFIDWFRGVSREKKNIVLGNIQTKLDAVPRYSEPMDDDIPF